MACDVSPVAMFLFGGRWFSPIPDFRDHTKGRKEVSKLNAEKKSSAPGDEYGAILSQN